MSLIPKLMYSATKLFWRITKPITLGVRLLLIKDGHVLLVKHTYQPSHWFLVGGGVKRNENLTEAAQREAQEEVGAKLGNLKLLGVYTNYFDYKNDHVVVFVCNEFTLSGKSDNEIERYELFRLDNLPENIASGHRRRIAEYMTSHDNIPVVGMW